MNITYGFRKDRKKDIKKTAPSLLNGLLRYIVMYCTVVYTGAGMLLVPNVVTLFLKIHARAYTLQPLKRCFWLVTWLQISATEMHINSHVIGRTFNPLTFRHCVTFTGQLVQTDD